MTKFNEKAWLRPYIDMNTKLRQKAKYSFEKDFLKLINNAVFRKTMKNVRKHRNVELVTTERRRTDLVSEPIYHTTKFFTENLLATEMRKTQTLMNRRVYLGWSILDLSKTVLYEFYYEYVKSKYVEKVYRHLHCLCKNRWYLQKNFRRCWNKTWHFQFWNKPLPTGGNKKVIGLMKDELGGQIMKEFVGLRAKTYSYLKDKNDKDKKKRVKKCVIKKKLSRVSRL